MATNSPIPNKLRELLHDTTCHHMACNRLGGVIRELENADGSRFFLKLTPNPLAKTLRNEYARLVWLAGKLPLPEVVFFDTDDTHTYLLLSAIPGDPAHQTQTSDIRKTLEIVAITLKEIHAIDIKDCPFVGTQENELKDIELAVATGSIDDAQFRADNLGMSVKATLQYLRERQGDFQEACFTHGDFCLPNVIIDSVEQSGIVDWAACGTADPYRDFSAIDGSIRRNFGDSYVEYFFDAYGIKSPELDQSKIEYYKLIDKYFLHRRLPE